MSSFSEDRSARTTHQQLTLEGRYYASPEIYDRETERIFLRQWIFAGRTHVLPNAGDYFVRDFENESVIVVRGDDGELRAFHNACRHRGTRICREAHGQFTAGIRCPYHAWTYGLSGELRGVPNMKDDPHFCRDDWPLKPVALAEWDGCVMLNLAPDPVPFAEAYAPFLGKFERWRLGDVVSAHQVVYELRANWKLVFQNYSECYHCPSLHPRLNELTPYRDSINDLEEGPLLGGPMRMSKAGGSMTMDGERCARPLPGVAGEDLDLVYYYTVFPNLLLSLHPDYVLMHRIERLAVDRTRIVCEWLFHPEAMARDDFDPKPAIEFWNMTNLQDWEVSERSQDGVSSRFYTPGPYLPLESMIAAWDREYLRQLGDAKEG